MLADISDETTFPRTLVIQRYTTEHNIETRIFYNYNKENNCIEINTISQFADNKPICLQEYYSIERGFPYKGNKTYEYTDYPDEEHIFTPLDESKWIEISMNPELRIHTE
ncbi:MAG: hypothetical protein K2I64_03300 [Muribaculaceae bacterium]|nr:hypothetical protein [Muribaculaceae bacterium]